MTHPPPGLALQGMDPSAEEQPEEPLPSFRRDLELYRGPDEPDGSPTYSLFDPVNAQFFKITWAEATLMRCLQPGIKVSQVIEKIEAETTIRVLPEEIMMFFEQAKRSNLLLMPKPSKEVMAEAEKTKVNPLKWLLFHYLYFRVPLFNPDKFLEVTLPFAKALAAPVALAAYALISLLGVILLVGRFDEFFYTFPYFFSPTGIAMYSSAIVFTKVIHEFAHGYVAKHFGVRVPRMGVAFILFWPVMYTDVTDSWKLESRSERLAITAAGVVVELILAGLCTLGWALTSPGILQSVFFVISSITWISTLLVNINPAMRFDGYYLFSDLIGVDNLQSRSFAYTRWRLRRAIYGIDVPPPEEVSDTRRSAGMMVYSIYTWTYRIFLYTAIAILVYTQFTKALGLFLFFLEIGVFLVWPFTTEVMRLIEMKEHFHWNRRLVTTLSVISFIFAWLIIPLPHDHEFSAVTVPKVQQVMYVPRDGQVESLFIKKGSEIVKGQPLARIFSKGLETEMNSYEAEKKLLEVEIDILSSSNDENRALIPEKMAELASVEEALKGLHEQYKQNMLYSTVQGRIYQWDDSLETGVFVSKDQVLGKIADLSKIVVTCYVPEAHIDDVEEGKEVTFRIKGTFEDIQGIVERVSPVRTQILPYPQLSSLYQGPLPVTPGPEKELVMIETYYSVSVQLRNVDSLQEVELHIGQTGKVTAEGRWRSLAWDGLKYVWSLFWEESTF